MASRMAAEIAPMVSDLALLARQAAAMVRHGRGARSGRIARAESEDRASPAASGAGAASRVSLGSAVFGGMLVGIIGIPICTIAAFLGLLATGRTINVISLAGLAFAVGMVLDAAIVVLENIVRLREKGLNTLTKTANGQNRADPSFFSTIPVTTGIPTRPFGRMCP